MHGRFGLPTGRVCIIESEVAEPFIVGRDSEVQTNRLGMSDMEVPIRFWWESGVNPALILIYFEVLIDDFPDEVG
jgi:hypothetical protein